MDLDLNYGELANDIEFVNKCEDLKANLIEVQKVLDQLLPLKAQYDKLSLRSKIELDLFLVYALNSLQWINLRIQGVDTNSHPIKDELARVKATMLRWQEVKDRDKRPRVDIGAAKRFVRNGLYDPSKKPPNKRIKFNDHN